MASPRVTTSFSPDMHDALLEWGRARNMPRPAEALRAFVGAHLAGNCADGHAMAFAAAREQYLAELRQEGREIVKQVAERLRRR